MGEFLNYLFRDFSTFATFFLIIFFIVIPFIKALKNYSIVARSMSQHGLSIENASVPVDDFFITISKKLKARKIKGLAIHMTDLIENSSLLSTRKYLVVSNGDIVYYISAFAVGTSQAFTYWQVAPLKLFENIVSNIPYLGKIIANMFFPMTLYRIDFAAALNGIIRDDLMATIKEIGDVKGLRELAQPDIKRMKELH